MQFIIKFWCFWLLPAKFYGGGGGNDIVQQSNPQAETLARIGNEKWDTYQQKYVPLENQWIQQVQGLNDASYHKQATGQATSEVKNQYGSQTKEVGDSMQGQRTGTGKHLQEANDVAQSAAAANSGVTKRYLAGEQGIIDIGNGQSSQTIQGLSDVASQSVNGQIQKARNVNDLYQAGLGTVGTAAGALTAGALHASKL